MVSHHCTGSGLKVPSLSSRQGRPSPQGKPQPICNKCTADQWELLMRRHPTRHRKKRVLCCGFLNSSCFFNLPACSKRQVRKKKLLWHQNWITIALTKEKNMEDNHHCNTSRTRLCSSHLNKNTGKTPNHYCISVWSNMKKLFANENLSFSSLIKPLCLKHCVPAS